MKCSLLACALLSATVCAAGAQVLETEILPTQGRPFAAVFSPDGKYILAGVRGPDGASLDVLSQAKDGTWKHAATQPLGGRNVNVMGILALPGTGLLAIGLGDPGLGIMPLADAEHGTGKMRVFPLPDASAGLLTTSADGKLLYVGDEYGNQGQVSAIAMDVDAAGVPHPRALGRIATPNTNAGVTLSADGKRAYATSEVLRPGTGSGFAGGGNKLLERNGCTQKIGGRTMPNGGLYTIDTAKEQVIGRSFAGCSPVRDVVSADGKTLYVNARGDDRLLAFDTAKLESDPQRALLWGASTGGKAPVGLALFDGDRKMLVANSNRFDNGPGTVTVLDLSAAGGAKVVQTIPTGAFPRNIDTAPDGRTLVLTVFGGGQLMVLRMK